MTVAQKRRAEYQKEFRGESELYCLHAILIATLRRRDPPPQTRNLFFRLWREQGQWLASTVRMRWRISAATTFADHGENGDQRALGMGLSVLFDSIKLHESERRLSGQLPIEPFDLPKGPIKTKLAFNSRPYSFKNGDLDRNLITRLWDLSERDATIRPLAQSMLNEIMLDQRTTFARVQKIKEHFK